MGKPLVGRCEEGSETAYHLVAIWTIVFSFVASFIYTYMEIPKRMTSGQVRLRNGPKESMPSHFIRGGTHGSAVVLQPGSDLMGTGEEAYMKK